MMKSMNDCMSLLALSQDPQPSRINDEVTGRNNEAPNDIEDGDNDGVDSEDVNNNSNDSDADEDQLTKSIITKWNDRGTGSFIRFLDGNTDNCSIFNLCQVSLDDTMDNIDDWKVDWDMNLTRREIELVNNPPVWRAGLSQPNKYAQPARDAFNEWCLTYGTDTTDDKFAIFYKNYVGMKRADAIEKAKAIAAGDEYESLPFTMGFYSCLTFDEMDAIKDHFGGENEWASLLDSEVNIAYEKWCVDNKKEQSDSGRNSYKMWYVECMTLG